MKPRAVNIPPPTSRRRRGSIYAVVLAMAMLVSLIGLSAVAVGRINLRAAGAGGDGMTAELLALSAVEHATAVVNSDSAWRSHYSNDTETPPLVLGRGAFTWKLVDEADNDLSAGGLQPARLFGIGRAGDARRAFSVVLLPNGPNLLTNPGMEGGLSPYENMSGDCALEVNSTDPHHGLRSLSVTSRVDRAAGPRQEITGKITSGKSYYAEAWVKMSTSVEEPWICLVVKRSSDPDAVFRARAQAVGTEWVKVHATLNPTWSGTADNVHWRIETGSTNQLFRVDDVKLIEGTSPTPMAPDRTTWRQEELR